MPHGTPSRGKDPMGFPNSASSLRTASSSMVAALGEIMSMQADEACGAGCGERSDARA